MWISRRTQRPPTPQLRVRLGLEALDLRLPPSSLLDPTADTLTLVPPATDAPALVAPDVTRATTSTAGSSATIAPQTPPARSTPPTANAPSGGDTGAPAAPADERIPAPAQAPTIVNFQGVEVVGGLWRFTGDVIATAPAGLTIKFGGEPVSLRGATTTTDANGHFDVSKLMNTDGSDDGLASAQTADAAGNVSNLALYNISPG